MRVREAVGGGVAVDDVTAERSRDTFTIRPAVAQDAPALAELRSALFAELGQHKSPQLQGQFASLTAASFSAGLERGYCFAWLAEVERQRPIGSAAILLFPRLPTPASLAQLEGYLLSVYTVPDWRRRGVAASLVAAAVEKARALGLGRVRLHTTLAGQPVYAAAGFHVRDNEMELRL